MASARSCFSTVRTALGKLRITGLPAPFDVARSLPQFLRPLPLQPTVLTSKRRSRFGIRKAPNHVPPPHLPDDPFTLNRGSTVVADVAFSFGVIPTGPVALPEAVITDGTTPLLINLTGTDPENDILTFSLVNPPPTEGLLTSLTQVPPSNATVIYTATLPGDLQDSFSFRVTDPDGNFDEAVVDINAPDPAIPPVFTGAVVAKDDSIEMTKGTALDMNLVAFADVEDPDCTGHPGDDPPVPPAPGCIPVGDFAFSIDTPPTVGVLTNPVASNPTAEDLAPPLSEEVFESVRTAEVTYTAPGTAGTASFVFQVCVDLSVPRDGDTLDAGECDTATVTIDFGTFAPPPTAEPPTAEDLEVTTETETPVSINLFSEGGEGSIHPTDLIPRSFRGAKGDPTARRATNKGPVPDSTSFSIHENGYTSGYHGFGTEEVTENAGWFSTTDTPPAFFWPGGTPPTDVDETFTITTTGAACVSVTDDFQKGDQFEVFNNLVSIGTTTAVAVDGSSTPIGPDAAFLDPGFSSGSFTVAAGSHSISIKAIANPFPAGGRGYIRVDSGACPANLTVTAFSAPRCASLNQTVGDQIQVTLTNTSGTDIPAGTLSAIGFYISTDETITTGDVLLTGGRENLKCPLCSPPRDGLAIGESITDFLFAGASINAASPTGNVFIGVLADEFNSIAEIFETDNTASQAIEIKIGGGCEDLIVLDLDHDPESPDGEVTIDFTAVVKNIGSETAGASTLCFEIGGESCTTNPDDTLFDVPSLGPGDTFDVLRVEQLHVTVDTSFTNTAVADFPENVDEHDENNNTTIDNYTVKAAPVDGVFATITALPTGGTLSVVNQTISTLTPITGTAPISISGSTVSYAPAAGTMTDSFAYTLTDLGTGLTSGVAMVDLTMTIIIDECTLQGRPLGCTPQ